MSTPWTATLRSVALKLPRNRSRAAWSGLATVLKALGSRKAPTTLWSGARLPSAEEWEGIIVAAKQEHRAEELRAARDAEAELRMRRRSGRTAPEVEAEIARLHGLGWIRSEIAWYCDVSEGTVRRVVREVGRG